ncbi:hypothetical protein [Pseudomonas arsenicoxydans]|uniref:hypothetical protein n=1 Tax=Pseudomonas arsenicoxydans TaxID=702115 RepID=UPI001375F73B|nr:hypothetical protein [Pseudomonas arsenicoxydans]
MKNRSWSGFFSPFSRASGEQAWFVGFGARDKYLQKTPLTGGQFYSDGLVLRSARAFPRRGSLDYFAHIPSAAGH